MLATTKALSLIDQKRLQWAKEKEEMVGLYGLWGRPSNGIDKSFEKNENGQILSCNKSYLLPPIQVRNEFEESVNKEHFRPEEESETSGYLSDSPRHLNKKESSHLCKNNEQFNNEMSPEEIQHQFWSAVDRTENYWEEEKIYKNYKNENWAHQNMESLIRQNPNTFHPNKNYWCGTPDSTNFDDGCRLRWGDRGVGVGHLWEPVINHPECRLPRMFRSSSDSFRQTPKWVEKGLKNAGGNKADILIIHHPGDDPTDHQNQKNFLLGQNVPIPPEVMQERERKRKKALEHQNAIKKQLEERELKRKQERENRIKEERLEEERIKKEQEIEKFRYEEEQKKNKQKEELEKKKEELMKEAIEIAEKRAMEDKSRKKRHVAADPNQNYFLATKEKIGKLERVIEQAEIDFNSSRHTNKTPRYKKVEEPKMESNLRPNGEKYERVVRDSFSQFEEIQLANSFQFLNVNGLPVDGGLALMLDKQPQDNGFLVPPDGMQLALLMSPKSANSTNQLIPLPPSTFDSINSEERTLTPSKYRMTECVRYAPTNKSTQTDSKYSSAWIKSSGSIGKGQKQNKRFEMNSASSGSYQKRSNFERHHKRVRCILSSKFLSKPHSSKMSLEDRPKWGINRPSVQYKKQSEKDPNYQKKIKERQRNTEGSIPGSNIKDEKKVENVEEREMDAAVRLLDCPIDDENDKQVDVKELIWQNGYRMNSTPSSPVFVPINNKFKSDRNNSKKLTVDSCNNVYSNSIDLELAANENLDDTNDECAAVPVSVGLLTRSQLEAVKRIANLREGLKKLQKDLSVSRSISPFSDKSLEK